MNTISILPINNVCNQRCLFCSAEGRKESIGKKTLNNIINNTSEMLVITGGETTLCKDLFWIIEQAKKRKLFVELQSNGVTFSYKSFATRLVFAKVDLFNINFPSHIPEISDTITRTRGFFAKRMEGINNLLDCGAAVRLTHIINSLNYKHLEDFVSFVGENFPKIKYIQFSFVKIIGAAKHNKSVIANYEEVAPFLITALKKCGQAKIECVIDHIPPCYLGPYAKLHVDYNKKISGADMKNAMKEKKQLPGCLQCALAPYCPGVRKEYAKLFPHVTVNPIKK